MIRPRPKCIDPINCTHHHQARVFPPHIIVYLRCARNGMCVCLPQHYMRPPLTSTAASNVQYAPENHHSRPITPIDQDPAETRARDTFTLLVPGVPLRVSCAFCVLYAHEIQSHEKKKFALRRPHSLAPTTKKNPYQPAD